MKQTPTDITNQKFGRLTAIRKEGAKWFFRCDCGTEKLIDKTNVIKGNTASCGCLRKEMLIARSTTHGLGENHPLYSTWLGMRGRCLCTTSSSYKNYGGRGIKICESWNNFENFVRDMGDRPENSTLDRIDNNGDYCPENCKWSTPAEQVRNTRRCINVEYNGTTQCLKDFCRDFRLSYYVVKENINGKRKDISFYVEGARIIPPSI
jgi:hypothetical protein